MELSDKGLALIARFEGCRLTAYNDFAGHATIGYGHLLHRGPLTEAERGMTMTQAEAVGLLRADAAIHAAAVTRAIRTPVTQNQFDALVSLSFNIGAGGMATSSLVKAINRGAQDPETIRVLFCLWCKAGGKTSPGLLARRNAEATFFLRPDGA